MEIESLIPKIDIMFDHYDKNKTPGCALAIVYEGKTIYKNGYGLANLEYDIPITPSTIFHLGSISKQFTSFAILLLEKEGKLSLDDNFRKYLPEMPDFGKVITIRHLCHHTSGLREQWELLMLGGWRLDDVITQNHILKLVKRQKELNFEPGTEFMYCNTGYTLLAEIVAKVSGISFPKFVQQNIFVRLKMTNSHIHYDHRLIVPNRACSYEPKIEGGFRKLPLNYANFGPTSVFTTAEDMMKWLSNLADGKVGGSEVIQRMRQVGVLNNGKKIGYAFGLMIRNHQDLKIAEHGGGDAGFRTYSVLFPDKKLGIAVLSNNSMANPQKLALDVGEMLFGIQTKDIEEGFPPIIQLEPEILDRYEGRFGNSMYFVEISIKNGYLTYNSEDFKRELYFTSETECFFKEPNGKVVFQDIKEGKAQKCTVFIGKFEFAGNRMEKFTLSREELQSYTGSYYSEELDTTYYIDAQDDKLLMQHQRHRDAKLNFLEKNLFFTGHYRGKFVITPEKTISGFLINGGGIRNLKFKKMI